MIGKDTYLNKLNSVQRKGLAICLNSSGFVEPQVLEVMSGILPLHLRREEISIREVAKIISYTENIPIKRHLVRWSSNPRLESYISHFGMMTTLSDQMKTNHEIDVNNNQPEFYYTTSFRPSRESPEYWKHLGSSKNRTSIQSDRGRDLIRAHLGDISRQSWVAFTDGSCLGNPGPCGAEAVLYRNEASNELKKPVSSRASILLGDLIAIDLVLSEVEASRARPDTIQVFSDSQSAVGLLTLNWKPDSYTNIIKEILSKINRIEKAGIPVKLHWTPGHSDIEGNNIADRLAKEAAAEASQQDNLPAIVTKQDVKRNSRLLINTKWQQCWNEANVGRTYYHLRNSVTEKIDMDKPDKKNFVVLNQLRTGYCLNQYKSKICPNISPLCECGEQETVDHFMMNCTKQHEIREQLRLSIFFNTGITELSKELFLNCNSDNDPYPEYKDRILELFSIFLEKSKRFS